jgi:diphthine synthase
MLVLAGLGLSDENGITLEEIKEAKTSDYIFAEFYTNIWKGSIERLENIIGSKIEILKRNDLEEESEKILELASRKKVLIFVPGDPLVATTHSSLLLECLKRKIEVKIIHNSSIISAVCESGLHSYKFGPSVTIPLKDRVKGNIESVINVIKDNKSRGLHTLCFLDFDLENMKFLEVNDAIDFLIENGIINREEKIVVASCIGSNNKKIVWKEAFFLKDFKFDLPAIIVVPGKLHFTEREILELWSL